MSIKETAKACGGFKFIIVITLMVFIFTGAADYISDRLVDLVFDRQPTTTTAGAVQRVVGSDPVIPNGGFEVAVFGSDYDVIYIIRSPRDDGGFDVCLATHLDELFKKFRHICVKPMYESLEKVE